METLGLYANLSVQVVRSNASLASQLMGRKVAEIGADLFEGLSSIDGRISGINRENEC